MADSLKNSQSVLDSLADQMANSGEKPSRTRYKLLKGADLEALPPIEWRIKGILPSRGVAAIYGPSGSGKSFLVFDAVCAICEGTKWFGYRVKSAPVVYVALEGQSGFKLRAKAWSVKKARPLPANLNMVLEPFRLNQSQDVLDLAAVVPHGSVIVVDTTAKAAPGDDENSGKDMGVLLDTAERLAEKINGLVWLVGHTGKDTQRGWRGWSGAIAAFDSALETSGARNSLSKLWKSDKVKDGPAGGEHLFSLEVVPLGEDEDGDPVSSCVVVEGEQQSIKTKIVTPAQRQSLTSLSEACKESDKFDEQKQMYGAHLEQWREYFYRQSTCDSPEAKRQSFRRTRGALEKAGLLEVKDDVYYPTDTGTQASLSLMKTFRDKA